MLTPKSKSFAREFDEICVSTDDDILENTKPNLISSSLSTSSSNHTVSAAVNSDRHETNKNEPIFTEKSDTEEHIPLGHKEDSCLLPTQTAYKVTGDHSSSEETDTRCLEEASIISEHAEDSLEEGAVVEQKVQSPQFKYNDLSFQHSQSMQNLYNERDSPKVDLSRVASQPLLHSVIDRKKHVLTRSLSTTHLKNRNHSYGHVESKVKHYIEQIKSEKIFGGSQTSSDGRSIIEPQFEQQTFVSELQKEIKRLQEHLEERDSLLQEVQANHHTLLLQYAEAKNRLDQLRLASVKPQYGMKSIQTEFSSAMESVLLPIDRDIPLMLLDSKSEYQPRRNAATSSKEATISDQKSEKFTLTSQIQDMISDGPIKQQCNDTKVPDDSGHKNTRNQSDLQFVKVPSWFTSVLHPQSDQPSCHESLDCSGSIIHCDQNEEEIEPKSFHTSISPSKLSSGASEHCEKQEIASDKTEQPQKNYVIPDKVSGEMIDVSGSHLLPIDTCECWNHDNAESATCELSPQISVLSDGPISPGVFSVPPLDLACSKEDANFIHPSTSQHKCSTDDIYSFRETHIPSTALQAASLQSCACFKITKCPHVRTASCTGDYRQSFDTPTSYKSIMINYGMKNNVGSSRSSRLHSVSASHCTKDKRESKLHDTLSDTKSNKQRKSKQERRKLQMAYCQHEHATPCSPQLDILHTCCCERRMCCQHSRFVGCIQSRTSGADMYPLSEILPDVLQCLNSITTCAQDLRRRSEAIQTFLTTLLEYPPENQH